MFYTKFTNHIIMQPLKLHCVHKNNEKLCLLEIQIHYAHVTPLICQFSNVSQKGSAVSQPSLFLGKPVSTVHVSSSLSKSSQAIYWIVCVNACPGSTLSSLVWHYILPIVQNKHHIWPSPGSGSSLTFHSFWEIISLGWTAVQATFNDDERLVASLQSARCVGYQFPKRCSFLPHSPNGSADFVLFVSIALSTIPLSLLVPNIAPCWHGRLHSWILGLDLLNLSL